jgi:hypothetical protein
MDICSQTSRDMLPASAPYEESQFSPCLAHKVDIFFSANQKPSNLSPSRIFNREVLTQLLLLLSHTTYSAAIVSPSAECTSLLDIMLSFPVLPTPEVSPLRRRARIAGPLSSCDPMAEITSLLLLLLCGKSGGWPALDSGARLVATPYGRDGKACFASMGRWVVV